MAPPSTTAAPSRPSRVPRPETGPPETEQLPPLSLGGIVLQTPLVHPNSQTTPHWPQLFWFAFRSMHWLSQGLSPVGQLWQV